MTTRQALVEILRGRDPLAAAAALRLDPHAPVSWTRAPAAVGGRLADPPDGEGAIADHRAAHAAGRASEATVRYGTAVALEATVERLLALAALQEETGGIAAICPVPAEGMPGSWGVQDLAAIAAARAALPDVRWVRPSWERLGPGLCQVAVAFGANDWVLPEGDRTDPAILAAAVGRRAVRR